MNISGLYTGSSIGIRGTVGYVAPCNCNVHHTQFLTHLVCALIRTENLIIKILVAEYGAGGQISTAGDSYSFGITLLEMFTGRAPTDDMFREGLSLHLFAEMALPDKLTEIVDTVLLEVQPCELAAKDDKLLACLASVVRVGISCSKHIPSERMSMKDAAIELDRIRYAVMEPSM